MFERSKRTGYLIAEEVYGQVTDEQLKEIFKPGMIVGIRVPKIIADYLEPGLGMDFVKMNAPEWQKFLEERMAKVFPGLFDQANFVNNNKEEIGFRIPSTEQEGV